ncbi:hypothetical protein LSCM1_03499 [Leishmania martiniquensis]|uniref:Polyprenol reductase n=1 Tax=Leishmania martiniquensis TaxID=1580590 RepID=A0A836KIE8_9TRYP|nr:hypothetical protein LSCM1_03499 [Leishmania martiniquensis]
MRIECIENISVCVALTYWAASIVVLLLRLFCAEFTDLSAYGARTAPATVTPDVRGASRQRDGEGSLAASAAPLARCCMTPVHLLASSSLGTRRVTRKQCFTAFYIIGLATSASLLGMRWIDHRCDVASVPPSLAAASSLVPSPSLTRVPLLLFTLHCAVRLTETRLVQRFRERDTVTLFAAVAGSTFYVMAAISSAAPSYTRVPCAFHWLNRLVLVRCVFCVAAAAHLSLQVIQVTVHTILARLRQRPSCAVFSTKAADEFAWEEGLWRRVQARLAASRPSRSEPPDALHAPPELHGAWRRYRYPYSWNVCFRVALDPHYTCEVAMYAVNTALMLLCVLPDAASPAIGVIAGAEGSVGGRLPRDEPWWSGIACARVLWLPVLSSVGVTMFTAANLSITSAGHRRFWRATNATRRLVADVVRTILDEEQSKAHGNGGDRVPTEVLRAAEDMLREALVEEVVPRWNMFPLVW